MTRLIAVTVASGLACSLFCGCASFVSVVQINKTPKTRTAVIIPSGISADEKDFSASVEAAMLRLGIPLVERPAYKFTDAGPSTSGGANIPNTASNQGQAPTITNNISSSPRIIDIVSMYDDTKADFIVVTHFDNYTRRIRIIRRQDRAVVGVIDFNSDLDSRESMDKLDFLLHRAGIIAGSPVEMRCTTTGVVLPR